MKMVHDYVTEAQAAFQPKLPGTFSGSCGFLMVLFWPLQDLPHLIIGIMCVQNKVLSVSNNLHCRTCLKVPETFGKFCPSSRDFSQGGGTISPEEQKGSWLKFLQL